MGRIFADPSAPALIICYGLGDNMGCAYKGRRAPVLALGIRLSDIGDLSCK
ncbi:hypothetical protein KKG61_08665 [bacterium]|nr:hypothetical protein [bacterium]MBU2462097.1 hypothetical protein [bacterium]